MLGLLTDIKKQYEQKENCALAVVVDVDGSAPRGAGAYMLVTAKGRAWGTIGSGITEYEAQCKAQEQIAAKRNKLCTFSLTPQENKMCGGMQMVLLHYLDMQEEESRANIAELIALVESGKSFWLQVPYVTGKLEFSAERLEAEGISGHCGNVELNSKLYYVEEFNYDGMVYIFGGGHVAQELVPVLSHVDFRCVVIDDRAEFANGELFPAAVDTLQADYNNLEHYLQIQANDYLVIMTRAHTYDTEVERFALKTEASYIGVMGSKFKARMTEAKLLDEGYSEWDISRVITPIGLDINSETPAEIAISIAAQLIQERAKRYK